MRGSRQGAVGLIAVLISGTVSCAGSGSDAHQEGDALRSLGEQRAGLETIRVYESIEEAMPNVDYTLDGKPHDESELYVRGKVTGVRAGRSFAWPMRGDVEGDVRIMDFDARDAELSEVLIDVAVDDGIAATEKAAVPERVTISMGFQAPADLDWIGQDFATGSEIVALLNRWDTVTGSVTSTYEPLEQGLFIGRVADDGRVTFPAIDGAGADGLVPSTLTVGDLESADDQETIVLERVDGEVVRRR